MRDRHFSRRQALIFAMTLSAGLPLVACGATSSDTSGEATESSSESPSGSVFRFANAAPTSSLDVGRSATLETRRISAQVLDTLVSADPNTGAPAEALAESWEVSDDGQQVTFALRNGVLFSDGSELTAQTVADNFGRWEKLSASSNRSASYPYQLLYSAPDDAAYKPLVEKVEAEGNQLTITLSRPSQSLLFALTQPAFGIVPSGFWDDEGLLAGQPVGSGAYSVESWKNNIATLVRNQHYWGEAPAVDRIEFSAISTAEKRSYALLQGDIDAYDQVDTDDFIGLAKEGVITQTRDPYALVYLDLNLNHPVLKNIYIRRAIAHAVNRVSVTGDLFPQGSYSTKSFLPKSLQILKDSNESSVFDEKSNLARELVLQSGYDQEPVSFYYPTQENLTALPSPEGVYARIASALASIGLQITPVPVPYSEGYYDKIAEDDAERGIALIENFGAYRSPLAFIEQLMGRLPQDFWTSKLITTALTGPTYAEAQTPNATASPSASASSSASPSTSPSPTRTPVEIPQADAAAPNPQLPRQIYDSILAADALTETEKMRDAYLTCLNYWEQLVPAVPVAFAVSSIAEKNKVTYFPMSNTGIAAFRQITIA